MSAFSGGIVTARGLALLAKVMLGQTNLVFTQIKIGDGELGGAAPSDLTDIKHTVKTINITEMKAGEAGSAYFTGHFDNQGMTEGFYWREIGLYAMDPQLGNILFSYDYVIAGPEYIPASGGAVIVEKTARVHAIFGSAQNVSAIINQSLVYATKADYDELSEVVGEKSKVLVASGTGTAIALTALKSNPYAAYSKYTFLASASNGGAATTIKFNGLQAKNLYKQGTTSPPSIVAGKTYDIWTDGTHFFVKASSEGNAVAADVLASKTFSSDQDVGIIGTMPNIGSVGTQTLVAEAAEYTIPQGYHNGLGKVKAAITGLVASVIKAGVTVGGVAGTFTSDANATAAQILSGVTAYVNGSKVIGTIPSRGMATITPSTVDQTIAAGQYLSGAQTIVGDPDLVAANILATKNIFGVQGSIPVRSGATQESPDFHMYPDGNLYLRPPAGYYDGATWVHWYDGDLVPGNVRAGLVIGNGVNFTGAMPDGTGLKNKAVGTLQAVHSFQQMTADGSYVDLSKATVTGLNFTPELVLLRPNGGYPSYGYGISIYRNVSYKDGDCVVTRGIPNGIGAVDVYNIKLGYNGSGVQYGGFTLPVFYNCTYEWIAFG